LSIDSGEKLVYFDATRCQILTLKSTKFDFRWGSAPDPLGSLMCSQDPLAAFKGPTSNGRAGEEVRGRGTGEKEKGEKGRGRDVRKGKGRGQPHIFWPRTAPAKLLDSQVLLTTLATVAAPWLDCLAPRGSFLLLLHVRRA